MKLYNVTLIAIDGAGNRPELKKVLTYCCKSIIFNDVLLLSSNINLYNSNSFKIIEIDKLSYAGWNKFIIKELYKYINTSHYLFVDYDGFIINPNLWDDRFLDYDYIGSPWKYPNHIFTNVVDQKIKERNASQINLVGNGGFTLRSKKLLEIAKDCSDTRYNPEDVYICTNNYDYFINNGIKFAPVEIANKFSNDPPNMKDCFGFHGDKGLLHNI